MAKAKPVYCFETETLYESARKASKDLNISAVSIGNCCRGKIFSTHGKHFCFEQDIFDYKIKEGWRGKRVVAFKKEDPSSKLYFNSLTEASKFFKVSVSNISQAIHKKGRICKGYFLEERTDV